MPSIVGELAAGVVVEAAKGLYSSVAKPWVDRYLERHTPLAVAKAEANTLDFLVELVQRVQRLEAANSGSARGQAMINEALQDPDVAATVQSAVLGAARTSSRERHQILARAVTERLRAEQGSARAVASTLAVEVTPRLASEHLALLGLLTVLYDLRPEWLVPEESHVNGENWHDALAVAKERATQYTEWMTAQFAPYAEMAEVNQDTFAHLAAASCIVYERKVRRRLVDMLMPFTGERVMIPRPFRQVLPQALMGMAPLYHREGWLAKGWKDGLQHARPTPAGMLIGRAVHDAKMGSETAAEWEWGVRGVSEDRAIEDHVWDGDRRIEEKFLDRLEEELFSRLRRKADRWKHALGLYR